MFSKNLVSLFDDIFFLMAADLTISVVSSNPLNSMHDHNRALHLIMSIWRNCRCWLGSVLILVRYDILNENGDFLSHSEISEKFGVRCHFLQALQIRQSLPLEWRRVIRSEYSYKPVREPFIYHKGAVLQLDKCTTKFIYECYVQMKYVTPTCVLKWKTLHVDFDMSEEEWADVFLRPYICLRETKLQSFQDKIINRIINCNKKLFDMKIKKLPCMFILWSNRWYRSFLLHV